MAAKKAKITVRQLNTAEGFKVMKLFADNDPMANQTLVEMSLDRDGIQMTPEEVQALPFSETIALLPEIMKKNGFGDTNEGN